MPPIVCRRRSKQSIPKRRRSRGMWAAALARARLRTRWWRLWKRPGTEARAKALQEQVPLGAGPFSFWHISGCGSHGSQESRLTEKRSPITLLAIVSPQTRVVSVDNVAKLACNSGAILFRQDPTLDAAKDWHSGRDRHGRAAVHSTPGTSPLV